MRLKSIKISGFKSFVDPTTVIFPSNLCAVVGPNGCGKSNVIDAVRWVMGEMSAKNLRGDQMSDVIFNGSSARKPVGQATVELIFDNTLGRVKGEYANYNEISVKRKVTRDGQSNYILNGTKCRRRDITDIFLGTGLGARGYGIIEQGMISQLIESKPDELRGHVEEAAGISKYKERRRDTENRISRTEENLERLADIREELGRQLSRLERQAKAAEKYGAIKKEKRQVESEVLGLKWKSHDLDLVALKEKIASFEIEKESINANRFEIETKIEKLRVSLSDEGEIFNKKQAAFYEIGNEVARIEQSIENAKQRSDDLEREIRQTEESFLETKQNLEHDSEKCLALEEELTKILPKLDERIAIEAKLKVKANELKEKNSVSQLSWEGINQKNENLRQETNSVRSKIEYLDKSLASAETRRKDLEEEKAKLQLKLKTFDLEGQETILRRSEEEIVSIQSELKSYKTQITALRDQAKKEMDRVHFLKSKSEEMVGRKSSLETLQNRSAENEILGEWLKKNDPFIEEKLKDSLVVESGWEEAVETVLGAYLEANESKHFNNILEQIDNLFEGELLVFDGSNEAAFNESAQKKRLSDFVSHKFAKNILASVYVVDSLSDIKKYRSKLTDNDSLITQSGIWVGKDWLRIRRMQSEEHGTLVREKYIKQLSVDLEKVSSDIIASEGKLQKITISLAKVEDDEENKSAEFAIKSSNYAELKSKFSSASTEMIQINNRSNQISAQLNQLNDSISKDCNERDESQAKLNQLKKQLDIDLTDREKFSASRQEIEFKLEETVGQLTESQEESRDLMLRDSTLRAQIESTKVNITRAERQLKLLEQKKQDLKKFTSEKKSPFEEFEVNLSQKLNDKLQAEENLKEARESIDLTESKISELEERRKAIENDSQVFQEKLQAERINENQLVTLQRSLEDQIKEKGHDLHKLLSELEETATLDSWETRASALENKINRLGPINLAAVDEYNTEFERKTYLDKQNAELEDALSVLQNAMKKIDSETRTKFKETFDALNGNLQILFPKLFGGGHAYLDLIGDDLLDTGVVLMARPPGKKNASIHLLSGGEKALTAIALVFSIFKLNPAPFCMLDEVDAPLDDSNVARYATLVKEMAIDIQFIYITHNKISMREAEQLMGVTMHEPGVSRLVSVDVNQAVEMASG